MISQDQPAPHFPDKRPTRRALVAGNIRAEAARRRVSQARIAVAIGKSQQAVSERLNGKVAVDVDELETIAELLGVPAGLLLGDESARSAS